MASGSASKAGPKSTKIEPFPLSAAELALVAPGVPVCEDELPADLVARLKAVDLSSGVYVNVNGQQFML